jgi:hypothetical protein
MGNLSSIIFIITAFVVGLIIIIGTKLRWKFFVDPPESLTWFYTASFFKRFCGDEYVIITNYFSGFILILLSVIFLLIIVI